MTIAILVALAIAAATFVLAPRMADGRVIYEQTLDRPSSFGYRMAWLAVRTRDSERVIEILGLDNVQPSNWRSGIGTVYDDLLGETHVFVSPPVHEWTFVVGLALPHPLGRGFADKCAPLLLRLGRQFFEVQYYFCSPLIDFYAWARVIDGKLVRAFAIGDEGIIWNTGRPGKDEKALGLKLFELRGVGERTGDAGGELVLYPTEEHVVRLASRWSLDPTKLDAMPTAAALGHIGSAPPSWRPERTSAVGSRQSAVVDRSKWS